MGNIINPSPRICKSIISQARGLMFRRKQNLVMILNKEKKISLHMFFVFFPIDVLILDKNKRIIEIKRNFKPGKIWNSKKKGKYVVELAYPQEYKLGEKIPINKI